MDRHLVEERRVADGLRRVGEVDDGALQRLQVGGGGAPCPPPLYHPLFPDHRRALPFVLPHGPPHRRSSAVGSAPRGGMANASDEESEHSDADADNLQGETHSALYARRDRYAGGAAYM